MPSKLCPKCDSHLSLEEFSKRTRSKDGLCLWCRRCSAEYIKQYYLERKKSIIARHVANRRKIGDEIDKIKSSGACLDCGVSHPTEPYLMEFDHLRDKKENVSWAVLRGWSLSSVMEEIAKCELVCVMCHRFRTWKRIPDVRSINCKAENQKKMRRRKKELVDRRKRNPCTICGGSFEPCQMDFDHIDPETKLSKVSDMLRGYTTKQIEEEMDRCQLLCAQCHRRKHHSRS